MPVSDEPNSDFMTADEPRTGVAPVRTLSAGIKSVTGDAFGLGIALVVLPSVALYFGVERFAPSATISLPLTAIFGIMILFGALALVGTLYARLNLADPRQALGLPAGSMRAFMALSLIVLFAIISIMVYRSMMEPFRVSGLTLAEREALVLKVGDRVMGIVEEGCIPRAAMAASGAVVSGAPCADTDRRFTLVMRPPPDPASTDLAKQLLILVGTLMTSVTSFYFAARGAAPATAPPPAPAPAPSPASDAQPAPSSVAGPVPTPPLVDPATDPLPNTAGSTARSAATPDSRPEPVDAEAHADGCNVDITQATRDEDLPPARGGVAP
jgi:hypothetical protein